MTTSIAREQLRRLPEGNAVFRLHMANSRKWLAQWKARGNVTAWWPLPGQQRKSPIGLYTPTHVEKVADGCP